MKPLAVLYLDDITDAPSFEAIDLHSGHLLAYLSGYLRTGPCPPDIAADVAFTAWAAGVRRAARMDELIEARGVTR